MLCRSWATSFEFLVPYVYGRCIIWFSFLLKCLASLYDGACMLLISGLIGSLSLCILMRALSVGAVVLFVINILVCPCLLPCCISVMFVEFVFGIIQWDLFGVGLHDYLV